MVKKIELTKSDLSSLGGEFLGMYEIYPKWENVTMDEVIEYMVAEFHHPVKNKEILREVYLALQKLLHIYKREDKPMEKTWQKFIVEYWYCESDDEAYEMMVDHAKLYAQKLRDHQVITAEEEARLFEGELIEI